MQDKDPATLGGGNGSTSPDPDSTIEVAAVGLLEVDVAKDGDGMVLSLAGEFDLATLDLAEQGLRRALDSSESGRVVIDLRELTFICSTGIMFLVRACENHVPNVTVIESESQAVKRVLGIVGLDTALPSHEPQASASPRTN